MAGALVRVAALRQLQRHQLAGIGRHLPCFTPLLLHDVARGTVVQDHDGLGLPLGATAQAAALARRLLARLITRRAPHFIGLHIVRVLGDAERPPSHSLGFRLFSASVLTDAIANARIGCTRSSRQLCSYNVHPAEALAIARTTASATFEKLP